MIIICLVNSFFFFLYIDYMLRGFPGGSDGKEFACNAREQGSVPGSGRSPGEGNGNPLQYSYLENLMDRGAWQATVHEVTKSQTHNWAANTTYCSEKILNLLLIGG